MDLLDELRAACAQVAQRATHVNVKGEAISAYAASLGSGTAAATPDLDVHPGSADRETSAAFWLTLDAINFGSGWFPTLHKRDGQSGYHTIAAGLRDRFSARGPWTSRQLAAMQTEEISEVLGQDPDHELMALFARSLRDLGQHVSRELRGSFGALVVGSSAVGFLERIAGWECFVDRSSYDGIDVPFLKRAQLAAADLHRTGTTRFPDLERLTMFADNLVPHVLRLDGVLAYDRGLVARIERGELLRHGSPEEVEIRACALHAVELLAAQLPGSCPAQIDQLLWLRGQQPRYKAIARHRARCTAY